MSKGEHSKEPPLQNAVPLFELKRNLVLRYSKSQIEDSLYFLEKRGCLIKHGFQGLTRVAFRLSESALAVLKSGAFTNEEQKAFREALLDMKQPGLWGMKFNVGEAWRRITDKTVKVCAYNFSESAFLQAKQAIIELTLRTI